MYNFNYIEGINMPSNLMKNIELKRKQMIKYGNKLGLSSTKTIKTSQELDELLNQLDKNRLKK
ncbi:Spo0E family sporulation regulatory protein-aspartic acid phosphatase [Halalkalibacter akibai]